MYSNTYYHIRFLTNHISRKVFLNMHHHYSLSLGQEHIKTELLFLFHTSLQYLTTICFKNVFLGQCLIFLQKSSTIPSIWFDPNIGLFVNEGDSLELSIKQHPFSREGGRREWLRAHSLDKTKIINLSFFTCILIDTFTICVFIYVLCGGGGSYGMACFQRSENNFMVLILSSTLYVSSRAQTHAPRLVYQVLFSSGSSTSL